MFFLGYVRNELLRRRSRTILTVLGLAVGVALVIVATHDAGLAARAPRRLAMRDGRLVDIQAGAASVLSMT